MGIFDVFKCTNSKPKEFARGLISLEDLIGGDEKALVDRDSARYRSAVVRYARAPADDPLYNDLVLLACAHGVSMKFIVETVREALEKND